MIGINTQANFFFGQSFLFVIMNILENKIPFSTTQKWVWWTLKSILLAIAFWILHSEQPSKCRTTFSINILSIDIVWVDRSNWFQSLHWQAVPKVTRQFPFRLRNYNFCKLVDQRFTFLEPHFENQQSIARTRTPYRRCFDARHFLL